METGSQNIDSMEDIFQTTLDKWTGEAQVGCSRLMTTTVGGQGSDTNIPVRAIRCHEVAGGMNPTEPLHLTLPPWHHAFLAIHGFL